MDKFYGGMGKLGITEDQVVSHQRVLRQEALRKGEDFTKEDRQNLTHQLRRAALNPDSDEAQQSAQKVKESHDTVLGAEVRQAKSAGPEVAVHTVGDLQKKLDSIGTRRAERARDRARRNARFKDEVAQHNYEASVKALRDHGVAVSDEVREAISIREKGVDTREVVKRYERRLHDEFMLRHRDEIAELLQQRMLAQGDVMEAAGAAGGRFGYGPLAERAARVAAKPEEAGVGLEELNPSKSDGGRHTVQESSPPPLHSCRVDKRATRGAQGRC
ncbi:hypothetical protein ACIS_01096 [Anaplasma centrale str. Israel]|uniref:Uncharacterized protein n=1 Tax=Anaplasma centrale (strain Israel) TaxID=574556 RepID=D1ASW3_ANACI|nr:hypothetical protein [Anaplasma centrale]ACZ49566.1 hypothetical protein ACIS_01096 [Anaplasma centrale str. Israel]